MPVKCDGKKNAINEEGKFKLVYDVDYTPVEGLIECVNSKKTVHFYPKSPLVPYSKYHIVIEKGVEAFEKDENGYTPITKKSSFSSFYTSRDILFDEDFDSDRYTWSCNLVESSDPKGNWEIGKPQAGEYVNQPRGGQNVLATRLGLGYPGSINSNSTDPKQRNYSSLVYQVLKIPLTEEVTGIFKKATMEFYAYANFRQNTTGDDATRRWNGVIPHILEINKDGEFAFSKQEPKLSSASPSLIGEFTTRKDLDYKSLLEAGIGVATGADFGDIIPVAGAVIDLVEYFTTPVYEGITGQSSGNNNYTKFWVDVTPYIGKEITAAFLLVNEYSESEVTDKPGLFIDDIKIIAEPPTPFSALIEPQSNDTIKITFSDSVMCSKTGSEPGEYDADNSKNIYVDLDVNSSEGGTKRLTGKLQCQNYNKFVIFTPDPGQGFSSFASTYTVTLRADHIKKDGGDRSGLGNMNEKISKRFDITYYFCDKFEGTNTCPNSKEPTIATWATSSSATEPLPGTADVWKVGVPGFAGYISKDGDNDTATTKVLATNLNGPATLAKNYSIVFAEMDATIKLRSDIQNIYMEFDAYAYNTQDAEGNFLNAVQPILFVLKENPAANEPLYDLVVPPMADALGTNLVGEFATTYSSWSGYKFENGVRGRSVKETYSRIIVDLTEYKGKEIIPGFAYINQAANEAKKTVIEPGVYIDNLVLYSLNTK